MSIFLFANILPIGDSTAEKHFMCVTNIACAIPKVLCTLPAVKLMPLAMP